MPSTSKVGTSTAISDSDSDDDFYSNYVTRKLQEDERPVLSVDPCFTKKLQPAPKEKDPLDLTDSDLSDVEEMSFNDMGCMKQKAKKNREAEQKKLDAALLDIARRGQIDDQTDFDAVPTSVHIVSTYNQIQEDVALIKRIRENRFKVGKDVSFEEEDEPQAKTAKRETCIFRINDLNDYAFNDAGMCWNMSEPFSKLREKLAERRGTPVKSTHLTFYQQDLFDNQTPYDLDFQPGEVYTIEVVTIGVSSEDIITLKCQGNDKRPRVISVNKNDKFSDIAEKLREMGSEFKEIYFDHKLVSDEQCPADLEMETDDIIDLM